MPVVAGLQDPVAIPGSSIADVRLDKMDAIRVIVRLVLRSPEPLHAKARGAVRNHTPPNLTGGFPASGSPVSE